MSETNAAKSSRDHKCFQCGALYEVHVVDKTLDSPDDRAMCVCGVPLKDWIGYRAYIFRRKADLSQSAHGA